MKLSIITINYNHLEGLKNTAESILCQTWTDFEWIIVDGHSTDGSKEYIEELADKLQRDGCGKSAPWHVERFSLPGFKASEWKWDNENDNAPDDGRRRLQWCSENDKGIYNAMNKGIVKARGEYCLFMNSGDCLYSPSVLERFFEHEFNDDIIYGKIWMEKNGKSISIHREVCKKNLDYVFLTEWTLPHQASMIRLDLIKRVGFYDESLKIVADWKFFAIAIVFVQCSYRFIDILVARQEAGGVSDDGRWVDEFERVKEALFPPRLKEDLLIAYSTRLIRKNKFMRLIYSVLIRVANKLYR